jgi:hypothetical protein
MAAASNQDAGAGTQNFTVISTGFTSDNHIHHSYRTGYDPFSSGPSNLAKYNFIAGDNHQHGVAVRPTYNPKRTQLCAYESTNEYSPKPGMIYLWDQDLSLLPANHIVCDGTNGTPDMRGRYLELAGETPSSPVGNNTVLLYGESNAVGHSHDGGPISGITTGGLYTGHSATQFHNHTISTTVPYTPKWYGLHFIMYSPT